MNRRKFIAGAASGLGAAYVGTRGIDEASERSLASPRPNAAEGSAVRANLTNVVILSEVWPVHAKRSRRICGSGQPHECRHPEAQPKDLLFGPDRITHAALR